MLDDPALEGGIVRDPEWPTERKVTEQAPRRRRPVDLAADRTEGDGRHAGRFEDVRKRTDRTRAQWSDRGQQNDVHFVVGEKLSARRAAIHADGREIELIASEREVDVGDAADHAFGRHFLKAINGKDDV